MLVHKSTKVTLFSKSLQMSTCNWAHYSSHSAMFSSAESCSWFRRASVSHMCMLQDCISDVANWCLSRRLRLNTTKTDLIWYMTFAEENDLTLHLDSGAVHPVSVIRDLGVTLDCELSMKQRVIMVASSCFYHLRWQKQIRRLHSLSRRLSFLASTTAMLCWQGCHELL